MGRPLQAGLRAAYSLGQSTSHETHSPSAAWRDTIPVQHKCRSHACHERAACKFSAENLPLTTSCFTAWLRRCSFSAVPCRRLLSLSFASSSSASKERATNSTFTMRVPSLRVHSHAQALTLTQARDASHLWPSPNLTEELRSVANTFTWKECGK